MTTSKPTDIREFWIEPWSWSRCERNNLWSDKSQGVCTVHYVTAENTEVKPIHVVDFKSYEQLKAENYQDRCKIQHHININDEMKFNHENEIKFYKTEIAVKDKVIIEQGDELKHLKNKLSQFEGMTFSENAEITKLKAEKESYYHDYRMKFDIETKKLSRDIDNLIQERGKLLEQVKDYEQALELIADRNAHGVMVTIAREVLKKWGFYD